MEYFEGLKNVKRNDDLEIYKIGEDWQRGSKTHVLVEGDYNGRHFAITRHTLGFPDVYIEVKPDDYISKCEVEDNTSRYDAFTGQVHGGATYYGKGYWSEGDERTYIGWDYGHAGDYEAYSAFRHPYLSSNNDKKWSLVELMMSIAQVEAWIESENEQHWEELYALPEERDGT